MATITKEQAIWRVSARRSLTDACFYVDFVSDPSKGVLDLVAENLTQEQAESLALSHNASLAVAAMSHRPVRVEPHGKEPRGFESIDAAMRYIVDSKIRFWAMFDANGFVMASDNTFIPAIDGKEAA